MSGLSYTRRPGLEGGLFVYSFTAHGQRWETVAASYDAALRSLMVKTSGAHAA